MKVLVCGDRNWDNYQRVDEILSGFHLSEKIDLIIEGEAPGADTCAKVWATSKQIPIEPHPALWHKFGRAAGPIRNGEMLKSNPDLVIAFHNKISFSKGTLNMLQSAKAANIKTVLYTETQLIPFNDN